MNMREAFGDKRWKKVSRTRTNSFKCRKKLKQEQKIKGKNKEFINT